MSESFTKMRLIRVLFANFYATNPWELGPIYLNPPLSVRFEFSF